MFIDRVRSYVNGQWVRSDFPVRSPIHNPATHEIIGEVAHVTREEVHRCVTHANAAFPGWRSTPVAERCIPLLKLRGLLLDHRDEIARTLTLEHGKTFAESKLEIHRAIDNIDVSTSAPMLMMGEVLEDVSSGIDEWCIRHPLGTFAALCPFNFPAMIPFWFMPYALATGNTYIVKPSPRVPMTMEKIFDLIDQAGFPPGVVNCCHGGSDVANPLIDHPGVVGISFVGSTAVGRQVFERGAKGGKRMQVQAGAKNFAIVMPDAIMDKTIPNIIASAFDCAGQRCLALSAVIAVGEAIHPLRKGLVEAAQRIVVGDGLSETTQMGPVISLEAKDRIDSWIRKGIDEGARPLLDGRGLRVEGYPQGYWVGPTILDACTPNMSVASEEIFGPVLCLLEAKDLDEAISIIHANPYGNAASIFTQNGLWARRFKYSVQCGNLGVNIGVAAPMAMFHFAGMKRSFFGVLHGQGKDAFGFFTEGTVVVERWFG